MNGYTNCGIERKQNNIAAKNNKLLIHAIMYMGLNMIMVSEKSKRYPHHKYYILNDCFYIKFYNIQSLSVMTENTDQWLSKYLVKSGWAGKTKGLQRGMREFAGGMRDMLIIGIMVMIFMDIYIFQTSNCTP